MKTEMCLLILTEGRPTMRLSELADLLDREERTLQNSIASKTFPIPTFRLHTTTVAHVADVAKYIDGERDAAMKLLRPRG